MNTEPEMMWFSNDYSEGSGAGLAAAPPNAPILAKWSPTGVFWFLLLILIVSVTFLKFNFQLLPATRCYFTPVFLMASVELEIL